MNVKAKKHLGQHFLTDENIAKKIVDGLSFQDYQDVLEVGPGTGVLTKYLLEKPTETFVAEIDTESIEYLKLHYSKLQNHHFTGDFLKLNVPEIFQNQVAVIGNFPYNISSQILFKIIDNYQQIPEMVGMFQKEVAERTAAVPRTKDYGILSVLVQAYYDVKYLFTVHEHVFDPPPKVKSAVIRLTRNDVSRINCDEKLFKAVVKTAFNQRRKQMRNSLKPLIAKENPVFADPIFDKRPEQLSVGAFVELTNMIEKALKED